MDIGRHIFPTVANGLALTLDLVGVERPTSVSSLLFCSRRGVLDLSSLADLLPCFLRGGAVGTLRGFVNPEKVCGPFDPDEDFTADITDDVNVLVPADWLTVDDNALDPAADWLTVDDKILDPAADWVVDDDFKLDPAADWLLDDPGADWLDDVGILGAIRFGDLSLFGASGARRLLSLACFSNAFNGPAFCLWACKCIKLISELFS